MERRNCTASECSNASVMPEYMYPFDFESVNHVRWIDFGMRWYPLCLLFVGIYLTLLYLINNCMRTRQSFDLRKTQMVWNVVLAVFNTFAAIRSNEEFFYTLQIFGFRATYCRSTFIDNKIAIFWSILFLSSKAVELFDTLFVLLRKQKLLFLHWFHHSTVVVWSWFIGIDQVAMGRWFMTMNSTVHAFMYTYYALRAIKVRVPKFIAMCITTAQITQMVVGFSISLKAFEAYFRGESCDITGRIVYMSIAMYSTYFALFANFFFNTYVYPVLKKRLSKSK